MNHNQMKESFENWEAIKNLRKLSKEGTLIEKMDAESKLKYFWFVWENCWPVATAWQRLDLLAFRSIGKK